MKPLLILLYERLEQLIQGHFTAFFRGAVVAFVPSGILCFGAPMLQVNFIIAYVLKALGVGFLTFFSGIASALASETVKKLKKWWGNRQKRRRMRKWQNQQRKP